MSRTPRCRTSYPGSRRPRGLSVHDVADLAGYENYQSGFQRRKEAAGYGPRDSLHSGEYRSLNTLDDEPESYLRDENEPRTTPLAGSSRYNRTHGGQDEYEGPNHSEKEPNFTAMLQEQQHILYELLGYTKKDAEEAGRI